MIEILLILIAVYYFFSGLIWLIGRSIRRAFPPHQRSIPPKQAWIFTLLRETQRRPLRRDEIIFRDQISKRITRVRGARELHRLKPEEPKNN